MATPAMSGRLAFGFMQPPEECETGSGLHEADGLQDLGGLDVLPLQEVCKSVAVSRAPSQPFCFRTSAQAGELAIFSTSAVRVPAARL